MTQIFTGTGLGTHGSSLGQLGNYGPKGKAGLGSGGSSVYVNAANGNLFLKQSDGFMSDVGLGMDVFQSYNSRGERGRNWRFNFQTSLAFEGKPNTSGSVIKRLDEDGHVSRFIYNEQQNAYLAEDGSIARLVWNNDMWQYREGTGTTQYNYNANGQLANLSDRDGHLLYVHYDDQGQLAELVSHNGKQQVTWSFSQGLLRDVTFASEGTTVQHLHYEYDAQNRLTMMSRTLGKGQSYWISYGYVGDTNLISDINQSDGTKLHIDYDTEGRVKQLVDGEGRITSYDYFAGKTVVKNGKGESWSYYYDNELRLTDIEGPENYHVSYIYEGKHLVAVTQGHLLWRFFYNDAGDCIRVESPSGEVIRRTFDAGHRLLMETRYKSFDGEQHPAQPETTRYIYDAQGHLRFEVKADGTVTEHRYDKNGLRLTTRSYLRGRLNVASLEETESLSLEELEQWSQGQNQQQVSLIEYIYDWRGNVCEERHYTQINEEGSGVLTKDTLITYTLFDAQGRLIEKSHLTDQGISTTHYFYDELGRLIGTTDKQHNTRIEYDDLHHRMIKTDANGLQTIYTYDHSGLLLSIHQLDKGHDYGRTTYQYDAASRLIVETDNSGQSIYYFYDAQGRKQAQITSTGQVTEYTYDNEGRCIATRQYQTRVDTRSFKNALPIWAAIKPEITSLDRISQVIYNEQNQIAYQIDAQGAVIAYQYDAQGRVINKTAYANRLAQFNSNQLLTAQDVALLPDINKDRTVNYYYDAEGRLQGEINGEGAATGYRYDALGNLIETRRYANRAKSSRTGDWLLDAPEQTKNKDICTYSLYNAAGLKIASVDPEGYLTEYHYDANGLLIESIAYYTRLGGSFNLDENTNLESLRPKQHDNDHHTRFRYNEINQLIEEQRQNGLIISYEYNESGLVISKTSTDIKTHETRQQRYRYDALGRVIQSLDALGASLIEQPRALSIDEIDAIWDQHSIRYTYDNAGRVLSKTNSLQQSTRYFYNEEGLLVYTLSASGAVTEYRYNSFSQVETTIRYSAPWTGSNNISTTELKHFLQASADSRFDEVSHYEYNTIGMVTSIRQGSGGQLKTSYNAFGEVEQTIKRINYNHDSITSYEYNRQGLLRNRIEDLDGINRSTETRYDVFGRVSEQLDGRNEITQYQLNKRGEVLFIYGSEHSTKKFTYDAYGRILRVQDKTNIIYTYDDQKNTLTLKHFDQESIVVTEFNAFGDKITLKDGNKQTTSFHYDANGQLTQVDAPEGQSTQYHYDSEGHLEFEEKSKGRIIRYTYDLEGHVLSKTVDPDGLNLKSTYTYDGIGRQLSVTEGGRCTQFTYDNHGNLIKRSVDPNGLNLVTEFIYTDDGQLSRQIIHNSNGVNRITAYEWDALGRCITTTIDPDGLALKTTYEYDNNGNIICQTDPKNQRAQYIYDAENRLRFTIDARGIVKESRYDKLGNKIESVTYFNRLDSVNSYNESTLVKLIRPDIADQYQFFAYDKQSRLMMSYDSLGYTTEYTYDANDNLITKTIYAVPCSLAELKSGKRPQPESITNARITHFVYDGLNRQHFQIDPKGQVTEYLYNQAGDLKEQIRYGQPLGLGQKDTDFSLNTIQSKVTPDSIHDQHSRYVYDNAGHLITQVSPSGAITSYQYDEVGNVIATTRYAITLTNTQLVKEDWSTQIKQSANDRTTRAVFDAAGREVYRISATGKVVEREYDAVGNVVLERTYAKSYTINTYTCQAISESLAKDDAHDAITAYQYDVVNRLEVKTDALKHKTKYTYDKNNNVASKTDANNACWSYEYDEANQLVKTISPQTSISRYEGSRLISEQRSVITLNEYDSFGNLIKVVRDSEGLKQTTQYAYDAANRKITILNPNASINAAERSARQERQEVSKNLNETFRYNAFGELIESIDKAGNSRHWVYDLSGQVLYALDAKNGAIEYQYDAFGNVTEKTSYATALTLAKDKEYTADSIKKACHPSKYDRHESYQYDTEGRLFISKKDSINSYNSHTGEYEQIKPTSKYTYNAFGEQITTELRISKDKWTVTTNYYNNDGLKSAQINAEGYLTTYKYDEFGRLSSQTEYAGRTNNWNPEQYTNPTADSKDRTMEFRYDVLGQLTTKILKNASYEQLTGKGSGYEHKTKDLVSTYHYDALGNLVSTTDPMDNTVYSYYNELGQVTAKIGAQVKAGRSATTYDYDALGNLVAIKQWAKGATAADESNYALAGASNEDIITNDFYDEQGHLIKQTDGNGNQVNYSYDANGNVARRWQVLTHANGVKYVQDKRYTYDAENHLTQTATIKNDGTYTTDDAQYNAFGEVVAKGINGTFSKHIEYDKTGKVWRSNTQGYYQIYLYDLQGNITQVVTSTNAYGSTYDEKGVDLSQSTYEEAIAFNQSHYLYDLQRQDNLYDALGRLVSQVKDSNGTVSARDNKEAIKRFSQTDELDRWGNVIRHRNANSHETLYEYNAFDQVIKQTMPTVNVVDEHGVSRLASPELYYAYDALGRLIAIKDANKHTIAKVLDAEGNVLQQIDALGHHRDKSYDLLGQLKSTSDELGHTIRYNYDKANRLVSIESKNSERHYVYDEAGQLIKQSDGNLKDRNTTTYKYDTQGNQIEREQAGHIVSSKYDDESHKIEELDANQKKQSWRYDENGLLQTHTDMGGRITDYNYNRNGLLLTEKSTAGKNKVFHYYSDGQLWQYLDVAGGETVNFDYDAEGNVISKESSKTGGWIVETDYYEYDALGRLKQVRRRNPEDKNVNDPKDHALLTIDYEYDAVGNIRHTGVKSNYPNYRQTSSDDYYTYDENNRVHISKGQLRNGEIVITGNQGTELGYDAAGNLSSASKHEGGKIQDYTYSYNEENLLERVKKNGFDFQVKIYDSAGNVHEEHLFDEKGYKTQHTTLDYEHGVLKHTRTFDERQKKEILSVDYEHDNMDNLTKLITIGSDQGGHSGYKQIHTYKYEFWDSYQQQIDEVEFTDSNGTSKGRTIRKHDVNGQIEFVVDDYNSNNNIYYYISSLDGMRSRKDKDSQTSYLTVAGTTIGDLQVKTGGATTLDVYGGFTPTGTPEQSKEIMPSMWRRNNNIKKEMEKVLEQVNPKSEAILPNLPQDNLGAYTLQSGDTLQSIALQVYGDASLWYLIADANGLTKSDERVGSSGSQLYIGQRLNIPPVTTSQHHNNSTHKVMNQNDMLGNTTATAPLPPAPPAPMPRKSPWSILGVAAIAIVATVATILSAGALGFYLGGIASTGGLSGLISIGSSIIGGTSTMGLTGSLATGFAAGFIGNIAGQGVAAALHMQNGLDLTSALISGVATAATAGIGKLLQTSTAYKEVAAKADSYAKLNNVFKISSATEMMGRDAINQGINIATKRQQNIDWLELSVSTATAGFMNSNAGQKFNNGVEQIFKKTATTVTSEVQALASGALTSLASGGPFNAFHILMGNFGSAVGSNLVNNAVEKSRMEAVKAAVEAAVESKDTWTTNETQEDLTFNSDLMNNWEGEINGDTFKKNTYWSDTHGFDKLDNGLKSSLDYNYSPLSFNELFTLDRLACTEPLLGSLSMFYETGKKAEQHLLASGVVSDGKNDPGGISYGAYQLSSKAGTLQEFLQNEGKVWANEFEGMNPTKQGEFGDKWKFIASSQGEDFFMAQHNFIQRRKYEPTKSYLFEQTGLDIGKQPLAVRDAVWSASVQHGDAKLFLVRAVNSIKDIKLNSHEYAYQLVNTIYDKRIEYVSGLSRLSAQTKHNLIVSRYPLERAQALHMLEGIR